MGYRKRTSLWETRVRDVTTTVDAYARRRGMCCPVVFVVTMVVSDSVGVSDVGEGEARDGGVFSDFACAGAAAAAALLRPVPRTSCPEGLLRADVEVVPVSRNACHRPTIAKGSAVVSSNGKPSVR